VAIKLLLVALVHVGHHLHVPSVVLPPGVLEFSERGPDWAAFVDRLPRLVAEVVEEWGLTVDGAPTHGFCALVVPVRRLGEPAVLKLGFPDDESEHEGLALQHWAGNGAVRLLSADPHRSALLLERLHPVDLTSVDVLEACELVAERYAQLHVAAPPQLRPLTSYVERWSDQLSRLPRDAPVPHRLVQQAVSLGCDLASDDASTGTLIHADLHYENVLAGDREPWLVIDPKPVSGDPHYELAPMLWNRWDEAVASGDLRAAVRRRFHTLVDSAYLDEARARDWVVVRMLHNALWELEDHPSAPDHDYLTMCIAIAKAVQD
jgi:streptomycin 6-kinase